MGLSPGASDRYRSQRHWQWVDVTGLPAGAYVLRGIANPAGYVVESLTANNVLDELRVVPGTIASPLVLATAPGRPVSGELTGIVTAPRRPRAPVVGVRARAHRSRLLHPRQPRHAAAVRDRATTGARAGRYVLRLRVQRGAVATTLTARSRLR